MKIEKEVDLPGTPDHIWDILLDPEQMQGIVPGMESITVVTPTEYVAQLKVKISFIKARFKLRTVIVEQNPVQFLAAEGEGEDKTVASSLKYRTEMRLDPIEPGKTRLIIDTNVDVFGKIGSLGLAAMKTKVNRLWAEFGENLSAVLLKKANS